MKILTLLLFAAPSALAGAADDDATSPCSGADYVTSNADGVRFLFPEKVRSVTNTVPAELHLSVLPLVYTITDAAVLAEAQTFLSTQVDVHLTIDVATSVVTRIATTPDPACK